MKYKIPAVLALAVLSVAIALAQTSTSTTSSTPVTAVSASFSFTAINFPGATRTRAVGLNDRGDIVGDYIDSSGVRHGYMLHQGNFTNSRSFLLDDGAFTIFDFPGATATFLQDLNDSGTIVGTYTDTSGIFHGFRLNAGNFTTIDFPGAVATVAGGINNLGQIVGNYDDVSGITHGFLLSAGNFTTIDFPGTSDLTTASGISANGEIVGFFFDNNGVLHGFSLIAGNFSTVDFPGAFLTEAFRVNEAGQIVGIYNLAGQHGYLATANPIQKP